MSTTILTAWVEGFRTNAVQLHALAARAHGLARAVRLPPSAIIVMLDGLTARVREDGGLDVWPPLGFKSIASDPTATTCGRRP